MSVNILSKKLLFIFEKIIRDKYELNDHHADCLIQYLDELEINGINGKIVETAFFTDIILGAFDIYNSIENRNFNTIADSGKLFFAKLITIIYKNELQFNKVVQVDSYDHICQGMCNTTSCMPYSRFQLACIKLMAAQLEHYSGLYWLVKKKMWTCIICPCTYKKPTEYATAAYNFISGLIWKLNEFEDEEALIEILDFILRPITDSEYQKCVAVEPSEETKIYAPMMSHLNALLIILEDDNVLKPSKVLPLLTSKFLIELHLQLMLEATTDENVASILSDISFRLHLAVVKDLKGDSYAEIMSQNISAYCKIIQKLIAKQMTKAIVDFTVRCNICMGKYKGTKIPVLKFERDGKEYEFLTQFVIHIVSLLWAYYMTSMRGKTLLDSVSDLDTFYCKIQNVVPEDIILSARAFKTFVMKSDDIQKAAMYTVKELFNFKGQLNAAQAGILYQTLFYMLQIYVPLDDQDNIILNIAPLKTCEDVKFLSLVLAAIKMLLKEHDLSWYENYEVICLQTCLMNFLKHDILPTKLRLQAMELIELSVKKFLSPALILLTESNRGSTLSEVTALTKDYMLREEWEIRDSALQLLYVCTDLAFIKYVPLQNLIYENDLMVIAAHCALQDPEYYVQATALKCLVAATKINDIWRQVLDAYQNLYVRLLDMVVNNPEAILRKEAMNVLTEAYAYHRISCDCSRHVYGVISAVALKDLDWEVQIAALNFWDCVIKENWSSRGMIDGTFPSMTFSKQKRKIIAFTEEEIQKQINGAMKDLAFIGCLNVLYTCLNDEDNVEIMEVAYRITKDLMEILDRYKFSQVQNVAICNSSSEGIYCVKNPITPDISEGSPSVEVLNLRDNVIDEIVQTNQCELILDLYRNSCEDSPTKNTDYNYITVSPKDIIDPNKFIAHFKTKDYLHIIEKKRKWNPGSVSLDDLIEDILNSEKMHVDLVT